MSIHCGFLQPEMTEMVDVLTWRAKLKSDHHRRHTNTQLLYTSDAFPTNSVKALRPPQYAHAPMGLWPFDLENGVRVTCDVGYLCANFSLPRPLCSRLRPDVRDRQTDVRQHHHLIPSPRGQGHNNRGTETYMQLCNNEYSNIYCHI